MTTVNVYLTFDGNCESAFNFYKSVFGGEFDSMSRYGEMPPSSEYTVSDTDKNKVMHVSLPISKETVLMGSDTPGGYGPKFVVGNNFSISVHPDNRAEGDRIFNALSADGQVTMPMQDQFWGSYFGMLTDQFGINWMVNVDIQGESS